MLMKKTLGIILLLLLSVVLFSCNEVTTEENNYLNSAVLINDLNDFIKDVLKNQHLQSYIYETYSENKILQEDYNVELNKACNALFNYELATLINLYSLNNDYFDIIDDINDLYSYMIFHEGEFININYNFNHLKLTDDSFNLNLSLDEKYNVYNANFEKLDRDLTINNDLINRLTKETDNYHLYIISASKNYKIILKEIINNKPYIINPNVYTNFSSDVIIYLNALGGEVTIPEGNITSKFYEIINNERIIIDKDFLIDKFSDERESFVFGINIYYENTYYLQTIHIMRDKV